MKRPLFIILAVVAVFLILGVAFTGLFTQRGASFAPISSDLGYGGGASPQMELPAAEPPAGVDSVGREEAFNTGSVQTQDRLVIENADLAIVVKDPKSRMAEITALANEFGGFVVSSNLYQTFTNSCLEFP